MKFKDCPGVLVQTPFSLDFITALKAMVPYNHRWFNEARSGWWVSQDYADVATHLASEHFGGMEVTDANGDRIVHTAAGERCKQEALF
jgi:hypothetical protein